MRTGRSIRFVYTGQSTARSDQMPSEHLRSLYFHTNCFARSAPLARIVRLAKMRWRRWPLPRNAPSVPRSEAPNLANAVVSARKRRNPQHLAGREPARIGQQSLVGFKDQMIFAAMAGAIFGFGDFPQRIAGL